MLYPTNLISITNGQIYLEPQLFYKGQKPAVSVGKSVSRVGGKTQAPAMRALAEHLRLEYTQFLELEGFTRFGAMADARTARAVEHGRRIRQILTQPQDHPLRLGHQVALLLALDLGVLDGLSLSAVSQFQAGLGPWLDKHGPSLVEAIDRTGELDGVVGALRSLGAFNEQLLRRPGPRKKRPAKKTAYHGDVGHGRSPRRRARASGCRDRSSGRSRMSVP